MFKNLDVICIGAALVDMIAKIERHPLEDDEVFVSDLQLLSGGAAANTAYACSKLGLKTAFIGKIGRNDEFGLKIIKDFNKVTLDTTLIKYSTEEVTGSAYVAINEKGDRKIYAHSGAADFLSADDINLRDLVKSRIIFLSSLRNLAPFEKAAKIAKENYIPLILNPGMLIIDQGFEKIKNLFINTDILIISKREFQSLFHIREKKIDKQIIEDKAKILFNLGIKVIIVTIGKNGSIILNSERSELIKPIHIKHVIDTTGAGDAFSAGFIYGFIKNLSFEFEDLKFNVMIGNLVAGKCIQELGARNGIPTPDGLGINL
ncbi:MAG: carbohydrate kinase family protein [Candidatus Thorarchaeota archaeon]